MATTGTFTLDLNQLRDVTNYSVQTAETVTAELEAQGSLIGLGIAIAVALTLIFGAVFLVVNFVPALIRKIKGIRAK